jgi:hypothetical protein
MSVVASILIYCLKSGAIMKLCAIHYGLPPDVRYRLENQAPLMNLILTAPASPPDVRRGSAPPLCLILGLG